MRPFSWNLFGLFIAYIVGILISKSGVISILPVIILCGAFLLLSIVLTNKKVISVFLILLAVLLGFLNFELDKSKIKALEELSDYRNVELKGLVSSIPDKKDELLKFSLHLTGMDNEDLDANLHLNAYSGYTTSIEPGDDLVLKGDFRKIRNEVIFLVKSYEIISQKFSFKRYIYRIKKYALDKVDKLYPDEYAFFVKATILGQTGKSIQNIRGKFQELGLAHILAISGLHVGLVFFFFLFLLKSLYIRGRIRGCMLAVIMLGYMLITGARPPVVRATVMALVYIYFWFFYTKVNPFNVLIFTAFLMSLINPETIFQASFLLSFSAMLGIFMMLYLFTNKGNKLFNYFKVALGAWLFVAPLSWFYFKGIALFGLLFNIVFLPVFSFLIACVFSSIVASFVSATVAIFFAHASYPFFYILFKVLDNISKIRFCFLKLPPVSIWVVVLIYIVLTTIIFIVRDIIRKKQKIYTDSQDVP
ncbi:MAG: ComEC/Rec2 family competence protein [Candidatus Saelkia tenebricola]|nr:ComEC/Rec2 family competence protein [Candidatus Saelkia tenebricola]